MDYLGYLKPGTVLDTLALAKDRLKPSLGDLAQQIFQGVQYYQQAKSQKLQDELAKKELDIKKEYSAANTKKTDQDVEQSKWYTGTRWPAEFDIMKNKDAREEASFPLGIFGEISRAVGDGRMSKEEGAELFGRITKTPANPESFVQAYKLWDLYSKGREAETKNVEADTKYKGAATKNIETQGRSGGGGYGGGGGQSKDKEYYLSGDKTEDMLTSLYTNVGGNPLKFGGELNTILSYMNPLERIATYLKADAMWRAKAGGSSLEDSIKAAQTKVLTPDADPESPTQKPPARPTATGQAFTPPPIPQGQGATGWTPWGNLASYTDQNGNGYRWY